MTVVQDSWKNPYIDLLATRPQSIVACASGKLSDDERAQIASKISFFKDVICELGSGSGEHLVERASADRETLYIGFELRFKRAYKTAEKAENRGLQNVLVIRTDAREIATLFAESSLAGIHINFPDPWARKRRWLKHRLITADFVTLMASRLRPGGFFDHKTDFFLGFEDTVNFVRQCPQFCIKSVINDLHKDANPSFNVLTEFEKLFISKGLPVFYVRAEKVSSKI